MTVKPNFKSVIVIGAFNPSILTPGFLEEYCGFAPDQQPTGRTTPVASEIDFGDIKFFMELGQLQVIEKHPENFNKLFPLEITAKYLDVLQYTPLNKCGVNFNFTIEDLDLGAVRKEFYDTWQLGSKLAYDPSSTSFVFGKQQSDELVLIEFAVTRMMGEIKNAVKVNFQDQAVSVNNNFEIGDLHASREDFRILINRYDDLKAENESLISRIVR